MVLAKGGHTVIEASQYKKPDDVIDAFLRHFHVMHGPEAKGRAGVHLWRGNRELGTVHDVRQTHALWQKTVDQWTEKKGSVWRKRRADPKTGKLPNSPSIARKKPKGGS
ncbi:MAG: hypothetical protein L6R39_001147 [Caloplaca ligustica]|nr:MAG: hypothetical protein L6R39_001147 [Caloplaca ligustica]